MATLLRNMSRIVICLEISNGDCGRRVFNVGPLWLIRFPGFGIEYKDSRASDCRLRCTVSECEIGRDVRRFRPIQKGRGEMVVLCQAKQGSEGYRIIDL